MKSKADYQAMSCISYEKRYSKLLEMVDKVAEAATNRGDFFFSIPLQNLCGVDVNNFCRYLMARGFEVNIVKGGYLDENVDRLDVLF